MQSIKDIKELFEQAEKSSGMLFFRSIKRMNVQVCRNLSHSMRTNL